jgi:hypothetical protein
MKWGFKRICLLWRRVNGAWGAKRISFPKKSLSTIRIGIVLFVRPSKSCGQGAFYKARKHIEYKAVFGVCARCPLRPKCTRSKDGRTLKRHERQDELDRMRRQSQSLESKEDIKTRQHLSERSFARSVRYGFKRARWRRLWRVRIQDFLIAAIQNIIVLIKNSMGILSKSRVPMARAIEPFLSLSKKTGCSLIPFWICSILKLSMPTTQFEQQPVNGLLLK